MSKSEDYLFGSGARRLQLMLITSIRNLIKRWAREDKLCDCPARGR